MRHSKNRRRFQVILVVLLFLCTALFLEERIEAFVPDVKSFAELKVGEAFNGKIQLSIGSLEGGILNPIVVNDIRVKDNKDVSAVPYLVVSSIRTNYRIWDVLFSAKDANAVSNMVLGVNKIDANFTTMNKELSGFVRLENDSGELKFTGYVSMPCEDRIDFSGVVKEDTFDVEIRPRSGFIKAEGKIDESGELKVNFKATHLNFGGFDMVFDGILKARFIKNTGIKESIAFIGEVETKNLLLNYKPFLDFKASFKICDGVLEIPEFGMSDLVKGRAKIGLSKPASIDAMFTTNNLSVNWLLLGLGVSNPASILTGTLNGKFIFRGPADKLRSNIQLDIRKGTIATLDFDYLSVNFKGEGPVLRIDDSRITRPSGFFSLAGELDITRIGKNNLFDTIKISSDERAIDWDRLDVTKVQDVQEVRLKKRINDDININVKKFVTDEKIDESLRYGDEVQFEYKLHPNDSLKLMLGQEKDFFGFEHKDKF